MSKFYDFSALDRKGREVSMNEYAGEVVIGGEQCDQVRIYAAI